MSPPTVWAVVLAAGASRRMGRPKLALPWGDTTVLGQVLDTVTASPVAGVVVVTGGDAEVVTPIAAAHAVDVVPNPDWRSGLTTSLQVGLRALPPGAGGALVVLGDMPLIGPGILARVAAGLAAGGCDAAVPVAGGRRGHPVALGPRAIADLLALPAGAPPRQALDGAGLLVRELVVDDRAILADLDDASDYRALCAARAGARADRHPR